MSDLFLRDLLSKAERPKSVAVLLWLAPIAYMLVVGMYFVGRYHGQWADSDSAIFAQFTRTMINEGRLVVPSGSYPNGYAYQAISTYLVALTGLDVPTLFQLAYPLTACLVVLPAWLLYREWTNSAYAATLTTMVLFTQPEFLFVMLRSSHEKFTRTLLLLCLYWLTRSFKLRERPWMFACAVTLFYLSEYAMVASNNLLAHSFVFAVGSALVFTWFVVQRLTPRTNHQITHRLPYAVLICLGVTYLFTFYAYPPAQHDLLVLRSIQERIAALFLDVQSNRTNPYSTVQTGWISTQVYFLVSIANWLVICSSFVLWARQGVNWLKRRMIPTNQVELLVWAFYAAFIVQGFLAIIADVSGALGSNLQHRIFSSFSIIAVFYVGNGIAQFLSSRPQHWVRVFFPLVMACLAILAIVKANNEPILSNKWTFYRANEIKALAWGNNHIEDSWIWTEFDERLSMAFIMNNQGSFANVFETNNRNSFVGGNQVSKAQDFIVTEVSRLRNTRLQQAFPIPLDAMRVYDNGEAELYHTRPQTPFQR
jgi:hypothetical protein